MGKDFSEVTVQCFETPSVPSICRRTKLMEFQSSDLQTSESEVQSTEVGGQMEWRQKRSKLEKI